MKYTNVILTIIAALLLINCLKSENGSLVTRAKAAPAPQPAQPLSRVILCDGDGRPLTTVKTGTPDMDGNYQYTLKVVGAK